MKTTFLFPIPLALTMGSPSLPVLDRRAARTPHLGPVVEDRRHAELPSDLLWLEASSPPLVDLLKVCEPTPLPGGGL